MGPESMHQPTFAELVQWRSGDFADVSELEDWLQGHHLELRHQEPGPWAAATYIHTGYEGFNCSACKRPSIRGVGSRGRTCGRLGCGA